MKCGDFSKAFQENMAALGLPAPTTLFGNVQAATANLAAMLNAFKSVGPTATIAEIIGATTGLEVLGVIGAVTASFYIGAVIGSLIVAANVAMKCTNAVATSSTIRHWAGMNGVAIPPVMYAFLNRHPEVVMDIPSRRSYAFLASRQKAAA